MKKNALIFATCVVLSGLCGASRGDDVDTARAATRRTTGTASTSNVSSRQKSGANSSAQSNVSSRTTGGTTKPAATSTGRTATQRSGNVVSDGLRRTDTAPQTVGTRATSNVSARSTTVQTRPQGLSARTAVTPLRTGTATATRGTDTVSRGATTTTRSAVRQSGIARSATTATELRDKIMNRDYKSCRSIFFECMDEFCANKDSQLKRCACSSRLHEFDHVKKQLANAEDKMQDFSQRLLTVNMDKEDAAALYTATEGELAFYNTKDTSASKGILNEIAKKLKTSSSDDSFNQSLSAISLSLDMDSAFDSVDSLMGVNTATKEGEALYNAALPVCREMAAEVCDEETLNLAISGYQMAIEQDCTTVSKSYSSQVDQAREKIRESGALLDMSRLNIYQQRNSDDILTCKKKMLTQLSNTSVCGENLGKCLDMTGQYIDPTTGQAFLTDKLSNLANLIIRPSGDQSWTSAPGNTAFVQYLYSKKKYLEPAMENCQDIADNVWDEFLEDALAQIKLAQESKLEEVRQSCTTLTTQCLADTAKSLEDFDARALSTFGVEADKTVNAMCASVKDACTTLLQNTTGDDSWIGGMSQIATEKTYDTIIQTCREVGRACIIQACKSISGNFGLCENVTQSVNRKSIINRTACWAEVKACVASAGEDSISKIFEGTNNSGIFGFNKTTGNFYDSLYSLAPRYQTVSSATEEAASACITSDTENSSYSCIFDICTTECQGISKITQTSSDLTSDDRQNLQKCRICRIAENIWGNCEVHQNTQLDSKGAHNQILIPKAQSGKDKNSLISATDGQNRTLLAWFAINTGTEGNASSCINSECPAGYRLDTTNDGTGGSSAAICINIADTKPANCDPTHELCTQSIDISAELTNCCNNGSLSNNGTICCNTNKEQKYGSPSAFYGGKAVSLGNLCAISTSTDDSYHPILQDEKKGTLVCFGTITAAEEGSSFPSGRTLKCSGRWVWVSGKSYMDAQTGQYYSYYWDTKGKPIAVVPTPAADPNDKTKVAETEVKATIIGIKDEKNNNITTIDTGMCDTQPTND